MAIYTMDIQETKKAPPMPKRTAGADPLALNSALGQVMEWAYEHAIAGIPMARLASAQELADRYATRAGTLNSKIDALIRWQSAKAAASGFVSGLGGLITLPITLPANLASVLFVQLRMLAAIAILCGRDVKNYRVKSEIFLALMGNAAGQIYRELGMQIGQKIAVSVVDRASFEAIRGASQAGSVQILVHFAPTGLFRLSRMLPLAGGMIGGTFDAVSTRVAGRAAKKLFLTNFQ